MPKSHPTQTCAGAFINLGQSYICVFIIKSIKLDHRLETFSKIQNSDTQSSNSKITNDIHDTDLDPVTFNEQHQQR